MRWLKNYRIFCLILCFKCICMPDLVFKTMVYNRLPFLATTEANDTLIDYFFQEEAWEMQLCFQIGYDETTGETDESMIGVEANYSTVQKSILADLVAMYIVMLTVAANAQGQADGATAPAPTVKFLSKAKAGSADVEWSQISVKDYTGFLVGAAGYIEMWKKSAARKARNLGCIIDICDTCVADLQSGGLPFVTVTGCGCGCS